MRKFYKAFIKIIYLFSILLFFISFPSFSQSLDATFGNGGKVLTAINDTATANAIAIQTDGKIVVGGSTTIGGRDYFSLIRYKTDGSLDSAFGTEGKVITQLSDIRKLYSIALQQDGKIVAGGTNNISSLNSGEFTVLRYKTNGSVDSLFGNNGVARAAMQGAGTIKKLLIRSDGKILAGGTVVLATFENIPALAMFNANGIVDSSFGINGKFQNYVSSNSNPTSSVQIISDLAFTIDGKIVASAETQVNAGGPPYVTDFALLRFLQSGKLDSAFGTNGAVFTDFNDFSLDNAHAIYVQPDNAIILAGEYNKTTFTQFALAKYTPNGLLDNSFGNGGKVFTAINNTSATGTDVLADATGNLIVSGYNLPTKMNLLLQNTLQMESQTALLAPMEF